MKVSVVIASLGRREVLAETIAELAKQSLMPTQLLLVCPSREDAPDVVPGVSFSFIESPKGLTKQRNVGIDHIDETADLIAFLDDDIELASDYFEKAAELFSERDDAVLLTGNIAAEGAPLGGIERSAARAAIANAAPSTEWDPIGHTYGCNMVVRAQVARKTRFDEDLPLYGWLEDRDFGRRAGEYGEVGWYGGCVAAHLGVSSGRVSGARYGYSMVVNPIYLWRKGTMNFRETAVHVLRALGGGVRWAVKRDHSLGRSDRLRGCLIGLGLVLRGRIEPGYILEMDA